MAYNPFDPQNPIKVTKVNCKKCQFEGNLQDFSQASKYALKCPKCQEDHQLLFTFDNGKQFDLGKDTSKLTPRIVIAAIVAVIIFFASSNYLPAPYFQILTVVLIVAVIAVMLTEKDTRFIDKK